MTHATHWTERSTEDFLYSVASDFVEQIQRKMKALDMKPSELARASKVSKGRISQIFKDPGNISLETMIKFARALGLKLFVSAYEDPDDPNNERGPLNGDIANILWERAGRPFDMWDIERLPQVAVTGDSFRALPPHIWGFDKYRGRHAGIVPNVKPEKNENTLRVYDLDMRGEAYG